MATCLGGIAALAFLSPLAAHHSGYMYETTPIWVKGAVVRFEHVNPHSVITLEGRSEDGRVRRWAIEGPSQAELDRNGIGADLPMIGDTVEFCAFPYRSAADLAADPRLQPPFDPMARKQSPAADGTSLQYVAGHVMAMPDGTKRLWEPHGVLSECVRTSNDSWQSWLDLLNSSPRARQAVCSQRQRPNVQSDASFRQRMEALVSSLAEPCK